MIRLVNMSYCDILKCSTSSIETLTFGCITWHAPHSFQAHQLKKLKSRSLGEKQSNCLSRQCSSRKRPGKVGLRHHRGLVLWEEQKEKQKKSFSNRVVLHQETCRDSRSRTTLLHLQQTEPHQESPVKSCQHARGLVLEWVPQFSLSLRGSMGCIAEFDFVKLIALRCGWESAPTETKAC